MQNWNNELQPARTHKDDRLHFSERKSHPVLRVLIIDDDVESATIVESIFHNLGCATTFALSAGEAKHQLCTGKADIIVLDWILGADITAADVLNQAVRMIGKFSKLSRHMQNHRPKVITYSSLPRGDIGFPKNPFFEHIAHWEKPMRYLDLTKKSLDLLIHSGL